MNHPSLEPLLREALGAAGTAVDTERELGRWIDFAAAHRVIPLLYSLVSRNLAGEQTDEARAIGAAQVDVMSAMVRHEHDLLNIASTFRDAALPFAVLKGFATAHLDYADPSLRQAADVDILVSPDELARAIDLLGDLGWKQAYALPRHHLEFSHAVTLRNAKRVELDLHQRIAHRSLGRAVPTSQLLATRRSYHVAGDELWALGDEDRLIHCALHEATSRGLYHHGSSAADVLVLTESRRDLASCVADRAGEWGIHSLVAAGIRSAWAAAELPVPAEWERAFGRRTRLRPGLIEFAYLGPRRRPLVEEIAHLRSLPKWRQRGSYVAGYFATDPAYAEQTGRSSLRAQVGYLWSKLRRPQGDETS